MSPIAQKHKDQILTERQKNALDVIPNLSRTNPVMAGSDIGDDIVSSTDPRLSDARTPLSHDASKHSQTLVETADARLSDARTPLTHAAGAHSQTLVETGDARLSDARTPLTHAAGAHSQTLVETADARLSDARTPTTHDSSVHSDTYFKNGEDVVLGSKTIQGNGLELPHVVKKAASANVRNSYDAEATDTSAGYVKKKTITLTDGMVGQARFLFDIKTSNVAVSVNGRVYRNGVALGTEQSSVSATYETKSEDLAQDFNPGDTVELWVHGDGAETVSVQNFRVAYDDAPTVEVASTNS